MQKKAANTFLSLLNTKWVLNAEFRCRTGLVLKFQYVYHFQINGFWGKSFWDTTDIADYFII